MQENLPTPDKDQGKDQSTFAKPSADGSLLKNKREPKKVVAWLMLEAGTEFAFLIAVPLIVGILAGKWLDNRHHTHFYVIIGILLGITLTIMSVTKRIKDYKNLLK